MTDSDDGSTISLSPGEVVELVLDENATTGYLWSIAQRPDGLHLEDDGFYPVSYTHLTLPTKA